jgi:hypothetical protein
VGEQIKWREEEEIKIKYNKKEKDKGICIFHPFNN